MNELLAFLILLFG